MSYLHHWEFTPADPAYATAWPAILDSTRAVIAHVRGAGVVIAGPDGLHRPLIDRVDGVSFNGDATTDLDYEELYLPAPGGQATPMFAFCKTNAKPYDLAVTALLLRVYLLIPKTFAIDSDGSWDRDWAPARKVLADLYGTPAPSCPFRRTSGRSGSVR